MFSLCRLSQVCKELQGTLEEHETYLKSEISLLDKNIAARHTAIAQQNTEKAKHEEKLRAAKSRLAFLDCEELEKLQPDAIRGQTTYLRERKLVSIPTKFTFELKTKYPIREHRRVRDQGVKWNWSSLYYLPGASIFRVTMKTQAFKDVEVEVELHGWRKEIHALEISGLQLGIKQLRIAITVCDNTIAEMNRQIASLRTQQQPWLQKLATCRNDVAKVGETSSSELSNVWGKAYLQVGSISGYATRLGLEVETTIQQATSTTHPLLFKTLALCLKDARAAKAYHEHQRAEYEDTVVSKGSDELGEYDSTLETIFGIRHEFRTVGKQKKLGSLEPEELELDKDCQADIETLNGEFSTPLEALAKELQKVQSQRPVKSMAAWALGTDMFKQQVAALERISTQMDSREKPLGVAATLRAVESFSNPAALFLSMYRGERLNNILW
ncbi:hypothetical protein F66182_6166 [Fusarium sp. NRRL 66182]|nr:hypothetical protein F66182_6166 [Fusarium sp. NRRL 66182]